MRCLQGTLVKWRRREEGDTMFRRIALRRLWLAWVREARPYLRQDRARDVFLARGILQRAVARWRTTSRDQREARGYIRSARRRFAERSLRFVLRNRWLPFIRRRTELRCSLAVASAFASRLLLRRAFQGLQTACCA